MAPSEPSRGSVRITWAPKVSAIRLGLRHLEAEPEIDHRHNAAPQVDYPAHEIGRPGNGGDGGQVKHFSYLRHVGGKDLVAELEGEVLPCLRDFVHAHTATPFSSGRLERPSSSENRSVTPPRGNRPPERQAPGQKRSNSPSSSSCLSLSRRLIPALAAGFALAAVWPSGFTARGGTACRCAFAPLRSGPPSSS